MQKKSFLIKDILQKLNEDDSLRNQSTTSKLVNDIEEVNDLEKNLKKIPTIDSNQLLYDWHSLAMAAMNTQNNNLINSSKNLFNWNKYNILNAQDKFNYLTDQKKFKTYFPFNTTNLQSNSESINFQKTQLNFLLDEINENSNLSLCESSKFSDYDSNIDKSETSSLISIEDTDDQINSDKNDEISRKVKELRKEEKKKRKNRRNRTVFTELQLMGLERRFDSQKYLSTPDRAELANALGLSQLQVKTWYQNRRMKWKKQVMQGGCLIAPTKPKGRPRKNSIPSASSLGITFDTTSLLTAIESKKSSTILNKEIDSKLIANNKNSLSSNNLPLVNMNSLINKEINCNLTTDQFNHLNEINQQIFNKVNFGNKKFKLSSF